MTHPAEPPELQTLKLSLDAGVARLTLHRPARANALNMTMWQELRAAMGWISATPAARACILDAAGGHFCAGIDLSMLEVLRAPDASGCEGRSHERLLHSIRDLQDCVNSIERCAKPVIAAIHGACVGGGIDLVTACDLRYCGPAAWFSVKEIDVGIVADVGTLQRLPRIVGEGVAREMAFTARAVDAREAQAIGLVNRCFDSDAALHEAVAAQAAALAAKSPLALRGTKAILNHARDHGVAEGLEYVATWNAAMLRSADLDEALAALRDKRAPQFSD